MERLLAPIVPVRISPLVRSTEEIELVIEIINTGLRHSCEHFCNPTIA